MPSCSNFRRCGAHGQRRQPVTFIRTPTSKIPPGVDRPGGTNPPCPPVSDPDGVMTPIRMAEASSFQTAVDTENLLGFNLISEASSLQTALDTENLLGFNIMEETSSVATSVA